jgi:hypothetical protein
MRNLRTSGLTPCYLSINRFYPAGDGHLPSPNDEFFPGIAIVQRLAAH